MPEVRPIDAKALFEFIQKEKAWKQSLMKYRYDRGKYDAFYEMLDIINEQPTLDYEPVVHANWENHYTFTDKRNKKHYRGYHCSQCGKGWIEAQPERHNYCGWCGAKMDEED